MKDGNSSLKNLALISACAKPIMLLSRHQVPSVWIQNAEQCFESRFDDVDALLELLQKPNVALIEAERASARSEEQVQVLTTKVEKQRSLLKDSIKLASGEYRETTGAISGFCSGVRISPPGARTRSGATSAVRSSTCSLRASWRTKRRWRRRRTRSSCGRSATSSVSRASSCLQDFGPGEPVGQ